MKIVYLPGVWDVLHTGHINIIKRAKLCGDYLIVGVCSDRLINLHKGRCPAISETDRDAIIRSLKWVDETFIYDNPDQTAQLKLFAANIFVVGEDFGKQGVPEHKNALDFCEEKHIPVIVIPRMPGISSTEIKTGFNRKQELIKKFWEKRAQQVKNGVVGFWQSTSFTSTEESAKIRKELDLRFIKQAFDRVSTPKGSILELGCGVGRLSSDLAEIYENVYAIDSVQTFIDLAKSAIKSENVHFDCKDVLEFDKTVHYDCCLIAGVLPYLSDQQVEELVIALQSIKSVVLKESVATLEQFELPDDHYSVEMQSSYTAKYRSLYEIISLFVSSGYSFKYSELVDQHREESQLRVFLFERT